MTRPRWSLSDMGGGGPVRRYDGGGCCSRGALAGGQFAGRPESGRGGWPVKYGGGPLRSPSNSGLRDCAEAEPTLVTPSASTTRPNESVRILKPQDVPHLEVEPRRQFDPAVTIYTIQIATAF